MSHQPPISIPHAALAEALLPAVLAAARVQMHHFRAGATVTIKPDRTPVTVADQESEAIIVAALHSIAPGVPVVAEEAAAAGHAPELRSSEFFLVDPLDGTREFIADRNEFTINVALVRGTTPRFGLIYAPALQLLYVTLGDALAAATLVADPTMSPRIADIATRSIRSRPAGADGLVAVASRSHRTPGTDAFLGQYRIKERRTAGSSLKFCMLAKGEADIYPRIGPTSEWDTAAGHAILSSAGGCVTKLDGSPLTYGKASERFQNPDFVAWAQRPLTPDF